MKRGLLCIFAAWALLAVYLMFIDIALRSILQTQTPARSAVEPFWTLFGFVVSFLGSSLVTSHFLGKRSYVLQAALSVTFSILSFFATYYATEGWAVWINLRENPGRIFPNQIVGSEYMLLWLFILIIFHLYSEGRLGTFSWRSLGQFLRGVFLHPRRTFEDIHCLNSTLFSFATVLLFGVVLSVRAAAFPQNPSPERWRTLLLHAQLPNAWYALRIYVAIPIVLLFWWTLSILACVLARRFGGISSYSEVASLLGFTFLPSLVTIPVDLLDIGFLQTANLPLILEALLLLFDFVIPIVLWPLMLAAFAIKISERITLPRATLIGVTMFLPLFFLLSIAFL